MADVSHSHENESFLRGQIDFNKRSIRVYDDGTVPEEDVWQTLLHEILHGIAYDLHIDLFEGKREHDDMDLIALALTDTLFRNGLLNSTPIEKFIPLTTLRIEGFVRYRYVGTYCGHEVTWDDHEALKQMSSQERINWLTEKGREKLNAK